jgi:hypothetical protein
MANDPQPPPPPPGPSEKQPVRVDLFRGRSATLPPSLAALSARLQEPPKEQATRRIGMLLIGIFGFASVFVTWEGFRVIFYSMDKPENTKLLINEAVIPFIEKIGTFLTTVFGPLLAFILGYYFGQKTDANKS